MAGTFKVTTGNQCRMYYNSGTTTAPVWNLVKHMGDVETSGMEANTVDLKMRELQHTPKVGTTFGTPEFSFDLVKTEVDSTVFLESHFSSQTPFEIVECMGEITTEGVSYIRMPVLVTKFQYGAPNEDVVKNSVTLSFTLMFDEEGNVIKPVWGKRPFYETSQIKSTYKKMEFVAHFADVKPHIKQNGG
ncbi:MAG: hypothetical protein Q4D38_07920 [Planctomycetia bacterium]|nr:hypothetical protein [Planctomycetia bacterium]